LCLAFEVGVKRCLNGIFNIGLQLESLMKRSFVKMYFGVIAVAILAMAATTALAGDLGLVQNGDMELESRFTPHGTPGVDTLNGIPDGWGHSQNTGWNDTGDSMYVSAVHSMLMDDQSASGMEEGRSFVEDLGTTSVAGDVLHLHWNWKYDITSTATTAGDQMGVTVRTSPISAGASGCCDLVAGTEIALALTTGSTTSGLFEERWLEIPLPVGTQTFDIIFNSGNRSLNDSDPGKLDVTGEMWVDDVSATLWRVPEPGSLVLLSIGGVMVMGRRRRS
jgi:hypothetical protein